MDLRLKCDYVIYSHKQSSDAIDEKVTIAIARDERNEFWYIFKEVFVCGPYENQEWNRAAGNIAKTTFYRFYYHCMLIGICCFCDIRSGLARKRHFQLRKKVEFVYTNTYKHIEYFQL